MSLVALRRRRKKSGGYHQENLCQEQRLWTLKQAGNVPVVPKQTGTRKDKTGKSKEKRGQKKGKEVTSEAKQGPL